MPSLIDGLDPSRLELTGNVTQATSHSLSRPNPADLRATCRIWQNRHLAWEVEFTDEFQEWWESLSEDDEDDVTVSVRDLVEFSSALGFLRGSKLVTLRYPAKPKPAW